MARGGSSAMVALLVVVAAALPLAAWQSRSPATGDAWLDQDVVYLITAQEREAFVRLVTAEERERFIEQFWERRDPSPGTAENEFRTEHYRRMAYATERFATSAQPGWRTERGRMYIVYGPPDEIEAHPNGDARTGSAPYEVWRYRHLEGLGDNLTVTFVDSARNGDYRPAPGRGR